MSSQITKEDLLNFTHQLHCQLRGSKGIKLTGLPALNEIENILFFRFIEEIKDITGIPDEYKFTTICEKYASDEKINEDKKIPYFGDRNCYKLWCEFYDITDKNCVLFKYLSNQQIRKYVKSSIHKVSAFVEKKDACQTIQILFNMVYNKFKNITFDSKFYDIFGAAHEEFKTNEHGNGGKHTGQHFTPMDIKKLVVEELDIKSNEIYYEPCAGTGGFIHTVDKYVREKEGDAKAKKFKSNIYANECNPEMIKPLMINMLLHNIPVENIQEADSLNNSNIKVMKEKVDIIATNYPFGMSNVIDLNDYDDKNYWKYLIKGKNVIKNSSAQFIIHIYHSLKDGGRAGFVSDRGIIFNGVSSSWEANLRKFLIDNTNLYKIWLLPTGVFPYTSFATCVIFIKKGEKTKQVKIYEGKFKDNKKKSGLYINREPIKIFDRKELKANGYSLKLEEKKQEMKKGWVKLGDVIEFEIGGTPSTKNEKYWDGTNKWVSVSELNNNVIIDTIKKITDDGIKNSSVKKIIKGSTLMSFKLSIGKFAEAGCDLYCNEAIMFFKHDNEITHKFISWYLKFTIHIQSTKLTNGNIGNGSLNKSTIGELLIPSISLEHQEEIVKFLDEQFELYDINQLTKGIKDIQLFDFLLNKNYDLFVDAIHLIYRKMELDALQKQMDKDKKAVFNLSVSNMNTKEYKLEDLVEISSGKPINVDDRIGTLYPYFASNGIIGRVDKYTHDDENIICAQDGTIGSTHYYSGKIHASNHVWVLKNMLNNIKVKYLYYFMKYYVNYKKFTSGNAIPKITKSSIEKIMILIPTIKEQEELVKQIESIEKEQKIYLEYAKTIQSKIDMIENIIKKQNKILLEEKDEEENISKIVKRTKSSNSKKIIKEESNEEEIEEKPKVKKNKSTINKSK